MLKNDLQPEHLKSGAAGAACGGAVGAGTAYLMAADVALTGGLFTLVGAVVGVLVADEHISKESKSGNTAKA